MTSVLLRRSWRELTRHRLRSLFSVAALAVAVAGIWLFATPRQIDAAMREQIADDAIHDVMLFPDGLLPDADDLSRLRAIPNVAALDVRSNFFTQMRIGAQTQEVLVVGVGDFADQNVNIVHIKNGLVPTVGPSELAAIVDPQNDRSGRHAGAIGDAIAIRSAAGHFERMVITGEGSSVIFSNGVVEGSPVLYAPIEAVWALWPDADVFVRVELELEDRSPAATTETIDAVRAEIASIKPTVEYNGTVDIRPVGEWPGKDDFDNFLVLFWVIAGVSLLSSLVLIATTATTLVREQTTEIGIMKAIGGTSRRVVGSFMVTLGLLGATGTIVGTAIGIPLSNFLVQFNAREFIGVDPGWSISYFALAIGVAVGIGGTMLAALPALVRVSRLTIRDALQSAGIESSFGRAGAERALRGMQWLPSSARLGVRNAVRRGGRSAATVAQVALAIGTLLGFSSMLITMIEISEQSRDAEGGDIALHSNGRGQPLDDDAVTIVRSVQGVERVQPIASASLLAGETDTFVWGLPFDPIYPFELDAGRWFTAEEVAAGALVAVIGPALSNIEGVDVGDDLVAQTRHGSVELAVIGVDSTMVGDGQAVFAPISTVLAASDRTEAGQMWIATEATDTDEIDAVASEIVDALERERYGFGMDLRHIGRDAQRAQDRTIVAIIMSLGLPVVAIGMIGLASAITTSALERRREIGVLRSIGARGRDVRRVFRAEAITIIVVGWFAGIAVGYLVGRIILLAMNDAFDVSFDLRYPLWPLPVALVIAAVAAAIVLAAPIRHASRQAPGDSLRYQ